MRQTIKQIFPACSAALPRDFRYFASTANAATCHPEDLPARLEELLQEPGVKAFLPDLARVELALHRLAQQQGPVPDDLAEVQLNPSLELLEVQWSDLLSRLNDPKSHPFRQQQWLLFWKQPHTGKTCRSVATPNELLALKIIAEQLDPWQLASESQQPVSLFDKVIDQAIKRGLLLAPNQQISRDDCGIPLPSETPERFRQVEIFTLQWHITHTCDLHCRHCYDRSKREDVDFDKGLEILDQMRHFCRSHQVNGQVSFSGGNPFMHPRFLDLYRAAHERNLTPAILGNPVTETQLDAVLDISPPVFYQVSLEGLQEHNDHIRGHGNFANVLEFLDMLKQKQIYSMIMLTLTRDNMDQVLPLAEILRNRVDLFTYNRLAMVGEGANLLSPGADEYRMFVADYLVARRTNPIMALKDSLLNIPLEKQNQSLFGGCTGFGCGAAFNFVSLLPDGQVHACRKFPSPIGDVNQQTLAEIYTSDRAKAYRRGCTACDDCRLRAVCGGCLAVAYGFGLDPLLEKDPACFLDP